MPKEHSHSANATLSSAWGGSTHKQYLLTSPKCTQPHTDGATHIHLCPNTAVLSMPTPLPSMWGTQHINSTSSYHPSVLNPTRTGHPTYIYAKIRVCSAHLHHSRLRGGGQHMHGTSSCCPSVLNPKWTGHPSYIKPKYGCAQHTYTTPVRVGHLHVYLLPFTCLVQLLMQYQ